MVPFPIDKLAEHFEERGLFPSGLSARDRSRTTADLRSDFNVSPPSQLHYQKPILFTLFPYVFIFKVEVFKIISISPNH